MDIEIRSVIHYFFLRKYCAASTAAMIDSAYGAGTITPNGVRYWYKQFESGRTDLEDAYRSGSLISRQMASTLFKVTSFFRLFVK